jgi:deoxyribonuclease V
MKTGLHAWDLTPDEAARVQTGLRAQLVLAWDGREVHSVAGVDVSLPASQTQARAAVVVLRFPELIPLEGVTADAPLVFPYLPGLLSFREGPAVLAAWEKLQHKPDLVMFDGQGIAHPRGLGIAAQMGLWLETPTIGVAKSRLYGRHEGPGPKPGDRADLIGSDGARIGAVLRTRERTNPLYVSPGHLIDLETAVQFVLACTRSYRLPEPTRWAHKFAAGEALPAPPEGGRQDRLF